MGGIDWNTIAGPGAPLIGITVILGGAVAKQQFEKRFRPTPEQQVVRWVKKGLKQRLEFEQQARKNNNPQPDFFIRGIAYEWARLANLRPGGEYSTYPKLLGVKNPLYHTFTIRGEADRLEVVHRQYKNLQDDEPRRLTRVVLTVDEQETGKIGRVQITHSYTPVGIDFNLLRDDFPNQRAETGRVIRGMARPMQRAL